MNMGNNHGRRTPSSKTIKRREALKGLGAIALAVPALSNGGCKDEDPAPGEAPNSPGGSTSGSAAGGQTTGAGGQATGSTGQGASSGGQVEANVQEVEGDGSSGVGGADQTGGAVDAVSTGESTGSGAGVSSPASDFFAPNFEDAATCQLTPTDPAGEGPFFIHNDEKLMNEPSLVRVDMRDGRPGVEMQLHIRMLDENDGCVSPIADTEVYVWHTDALGWYSGFDGQNPDQSYRGTFEREVENTDRFCRGVQITDAEGIVSFRTLYPGWYAGRPIHVHFVALRKGSRPETTSYRSDAYMMFTTQMYFDEPFSRSIHTSYDPYRSRASGTGYDNSVRPTSAVRPTLRMEGDVVVASLNVVTNSTQSRVSSGLFGGFFP